MCGGRLDGSESARDSAQSAPAIAVRAVLGLAGGAFAQRAGGVGAGCVALVDQVVALPAGRCGLAPGQPEPASRGPATPCGAARAGQHEAQPEQTGRPDHDAMEEQRASRASHVIAEYREMAERVCAATVAENTGHPSAQARFQLTPGRLQTSKAEPSQ